MPKVIERQISKHFAIILTLAFDRSISYFLWSFQPVKNGKGARMPPASSSRLLLGSVHRSGRKDRAMENRWIWLIKADALVEIKTKEIPVKTDSSFKTIIRLGAARFPLQFSVSQLPTPATLAVAGCPIGRSLILWKTKPPIVLLTYEGTIFVVSLSLVCQLPTALRLSANSLTQTPSSLASQTRNPEYILPLP